MQDVHAILASYSDCSDSGSESDAFTGGPEGCFDINERELLANGFSENDYGEGETNVLNETASESEAPETTNTDMRHPPETATPPDANETPTRPLVTSTTTALQERNVMPETRSIRDHRKWLYRQKGAAARKIRKCSGCFIAPRSQIPKVPKRPTFWFAEGAETTTQTRLLCPAQQIQIQGQRFVVAVIYWTGSRKQGDSRFSPRSLLHVLLIRQPMPDLTKILPAHQYYRAIVTEILSPNVSCVVVLYLFFSIP